MEFEKLADFARENQVDLTIIGMDDPLVGGVVEDVYKRQEFILAGASAVSVGTANFHNPAVTLEVIDVYKRQYPD